MIKLRLLIWALILAIPGTAGLWTIRIHETRRQEQLRLWRPEVQEAAEQYLDSYQRWNALPLEQKNDTPWGQGEYGGFDIQQQLRRDQDKRLAVDIAELANGTKTVPPELASLMYGTDWQKNVEDYQHERKRNEIINILSSACVAIGALTFVITSIVWLIELIIRLIRKDKRNSAIEEKEQEEPAKAAEKINEKPAEKPKPTLAQTLSLPPDDTSTEHPAAETKSETHEGYFESLRQLSKKDKSPACPSTFIPVGSLSPATAVAEAPNISLMTPQPVLNSLTELTEEVSAIRQFAAQQQDQMRKLQDGYDWMLIRRFCMRIIRCIDNITDRIEQLNRESQDSNPHTLEDIRDELIFALESSGVESFEPDIGAVYKGLERYAEAVRERQPNDDPQRSGTIARVIRPGYQYLINDDDIKIVRCAQVQLYE